MATPAPVASSAAVQAIATLIEKIQVTKAEYLRKNAEDLQIIDTSEPTLSPDAAVSILYPIALDLAVLKLQDTSAQLLSGGNEHAVYDPASQIDTPYFKTRVDFLRTIAHYHSKIPKIPGRTLAKRPNPAKVWEMISVEVLYQNCLEDLIANFFNNPYICLKEFSFWCNNTSLLKTFPIMGQRAQVYFKEVYYAIFFTGKDIPALLEIAEKPLPNNCSFDSLSTLENLNHLDYQLQRIQSCLAALTIQRDNFSAFLLILRLYKFFLANASQLAPVATSRDHIAKPPKFLELVKDVWEQIQSLIPTSTLEDYPMVGHQFNVVSDLYATTIRNLTQPNTESLIQEKRAVQRRLIRATEITEEKLTVPTARIPVSINLEEDRFRMEFATNTAQKIRKKTQKFIKASTALQATARSALESSHIASIGEQCDALTAALTGQKDIANAFLINFETIFQNHFVKNTMPDFYEAFKALQDQDLIEETYLELIHGMLALYEAELFQVAFNAVNKIIPKNICSVQLREEGMVFSIHSDEKAYLSAALKAIGANQEFKSNLREKTIALAFSQATRRNLEMFLTALNTNLQNAYGRLIADQAPIVNMPAAPSIPAEEKQKLQAQYAKEETEQNVLEAKRKALAVTMASTDLDTIAPLTSSEEEKTTPSVPFADILTVEALLKVNLRRELRDILNNSKAYPPSTPAYHVQTGQLHMYVVPAADTLREMTEAERMILAEKRETGREFVLDKFPGQGWLFRMKAGGDRRLAGYYLPESHTVTLEAGSAVVVTLDREWDHDRGLRGV